MARNTDRARCIELALPTVKGSNSRTHWVVRHRGAAIDRAYACAAAQRNAPSSEAMDAVALRIDWYCPTKRRIDCDNALSRCKSYIDGLTLAGWWADDSVIRSVTIAVHLPGERRGVVVITATPE